MMQPIALTMVAAVNDKATLTSCLLASPDVKAAEGVEMILQEGYARAASAYNRALEKAKNDIIVFIHQDVYLPPGWVARLGEMIARVEENDPSWGVLGVCGLTHDGQLRAWVHSVGLGRNVGAPFPAPAQVRLLDEVILVTRRSAGLRFDEGLPGFHMYGSDLCLEAEKQGRRNYAVPCFAVHNSNGIKQLPSAFWHACWYVRRKWRDRLPLRAPCTTVSRWPFGTLKQIIERFIRFGMRRNEVNRRVSDPASLYLRLCAQENTSTR